MTLVRVVTFFGLLLPAFGQYAGPAILSRGEAPAAMTSPDITFRPFLELTSSYETGLAGVAVTQNQQLPSVDSYGLALTWGVSGAHNWKHTKLGLSYRGNLSHYIEQKSYDAVNQTLMLGFSHQLTRHMTFSLRESAGVYTRSFGLGSLTQTIPFDPAESNIPTADFFDNRTYFASTQADLTVQKSPRLSFNMGGDQFLTRYRAQGLVGVNGLGAHGDMQYRISRRNTLGVAYSYGHFYYNGQFGGSDMHGFNGTFARSLTSRLEFTGTFGATRVEQKYIQSVPVNPIIAALLGTSTTTEIAHFVDWIPTGRVRLSETFHRGVAYVGAGREVTPGNGLFITTYMYNVMGGYTFTGLRDWSFSTVVSYDRGESVANFQGVYSNLAGSFSVSRQIAHSVHFVAGYDARQYSSIEFRNYNRLVQEVHVGLGFTPGEVPLRVW